MVRATQHWSKQNGWQVSCRVGVAFGECVGGIVGTEMQRYHLFGELMSKLEVLESTAPEARVQVSEQCQQEVEAQMNKDGIPRELLRFIKVDADYLQTSKGERHDFAAAGGRTYIVDSEASFRGWIGA